MTTDQIKKRVQEIRDCANDDEGAHVLQDRLLWDFVRAVADSPDFSCFKREAQEVLSVLDIQFDRWFA